MLLGLALAGGYWFVKNQELEQMRAEITVREAEAKKLEAIINEVEQYQARKENLEQRIRLINDLKRNQKNPVLIMDRISQDLPDLVWLDTMVLKQTAISMTGRALNANAVATFVANVKQDALFQEPKLSSLNRCGSGGGVNVFCFEMSVVLKPVPQPDETAVPEEEGTPGGSAGSESA